MDNHEKIQVLKGMIESYDFIVELPENTFSNWPCDKQDMIKVWRIALEDYANDLENALNMEFSKHIKQMGADLLTVVWDILENWNE